MMNANRRNKKIESSENESESERNEDEITADKLTLFINEEGNSMHFVVLHCDAVKRNHYKELIENHLGTASFELEDIGRHSAALVDDETLSWKSEGEAFKLSYIEDSIELGRVLDISRYLHKTSTQFIESFNYMNIIYFRKYSWDNVPEKFKLSKKCSSDSSDDSDCSVISTQSSTKAPNKKTKLPYSKREKEAIVRYILDSGYLDRIKGVKIWHEMEAANICPTRTWQSMKEHFLKTISRQFNGYSCLTLDEKRKLRTELK